MESFFHQVMAGLATGGIYASLALALVMIHEATDLLNFAQGTGCTRVLYLSQGIGGQTPIDRCVNNAMI